MALVRVIVISAFLYGVNATTVYMYLRETQLYELKPCTTCAETPTFKRSVKSIQ